MAGNLHEYLCAFMITPLCILLRMRNVSDKNCLENQNIFCVQHFFSEKLCVCDLMWRNMVEPDRSQMTIKYDACSFPAGYAGLQTHTQNMQLVLLYHANSG
jgi:hypothetical protein